eukprot:5300782-Lingulodinium_polyedra.AAC.1
MAAEPALRAGSVAARHSRTTALNGMLKQYAMPSSVHHSPLLAPAIWNDEGTERSDGSERS